MLTVLAHLKKFTHLWTSMALKAISHVLKTMALNTPIWFAPYSSSLKVLLNRQHPQKFYEDFPASPLLPHGTWATTVSCQNQLQHWWCCDMISQSCPALQPHGLEPARLLCLWDSPGRNTGVGAIPFSIESSWPRVRTWVSHVAGRFFTIWATREAPMYPIPQFNLFEGQAVA